MALESFVITKDFKTPFVRFTGHPRFPQQTEWKTFKKGDIVNGELKHSNNKPAFVLVSGRLVVPIEVVKKVVTKDVKSNADGEIEKKKPGVISTSNNPKVQYVDAMLLGALVGVVGVYVAEKQGWIAQPDKKYKLYGGLAGVGLALYILWRYKNSKPKKKQE